jgi:hypothetical protein
MEQSLGRGVRGAQEQLALAPGASRIDGKVELVLHEPEKARVRDA